MEADSEQVRSNNESNQETDSVSLNGSFMEDVMEPASNVPNGPNKSKGCDRKDATNEDERMVGADRQIKSPRKSPRKNSGNMLKRSLNVEDSPPDLKNKKIRSQESQSKNSSAQRDSILSGKQKNKSAPTR